MLKKIESHLSEALKMINEKIQDGAAKESIVNELGKAMKELKRLEIYYNHQINKDSQVLKYEFLTCDDLIYNYSFDMSDDDYKRLKELILDNQEKIELPKTESLLYTITDRYSYQEIFKDCPEIIEFLDFTSNQS
jgi:hypothetical protein